MMTFIHNFILESQIWVIMMSFNNITNMLLKLKFCILTTLSNFFNPSDFPVFMKYLGNIELDLLPIPNWAPP